MLREVSPLEAGSDRDHDPTQDGCNQHAGHDHDHSFSNIHGTSLHTTVDPDTTTLTRAKRHLGRHLMRKEVVIQELGTCLLGSRAQGFSAERSGAATPAADAGPFRREA